MKTAIRKFFTIRIGIFIIASLCIALYTLIMISGYSGVDRDARTIQSKGDKGYYIFYNLLKRLGYKMLEWDEFSGFRRDAVLFYFHYKDNLSGDFQAIKEWTAAGNVLFLIGMGGEHDPVFNNKLFTGDIQEVHVHESLKPDVDEFSFKSSIYIDKESPGEVLLGNSQGAVLLKNEYKDGTVYLLSDSRFLSNGSLMDENNAVVVNNLVGEYYGDTIFVQEPAYTGPVNPVGPLFQGKLFYLTIHLLLMGLVFMLYNSIRFGNPIQSNPLERRTLQKHLDAVGYFYQKSNALHLAEKYGLKYFLYQVKTILNIRRKISNEELVSLLKKYYLVDATEADITELLSETRDVTEKNLLKRRQKRNTIIERLRKYRG